MESGFHELSAPELRILIIQEIKKFILAIDRCIPVKELQDIKNFIKHLYSILDTKEQQEIFRIYDDYFWQKNISLKREIPPKEKILPKPESGSMPDEGMPPDEDILGGLQLA